MILPEGIARGADFATLPDAMRRRGWSETRVQRVLGANWLRVFRDVWGR